MVNPVEIEERDDWLKDRQKKNFDQCHRDKDLPELKMGDTVWIPPGTVMCMTSDGTYCHNRQYLLQIPISELIQEVGNKTKPQDSEQPSRTRSTKSSRRPERYDPSWT